MTIEDYPFDRNEGCAVSDIFYQRARAGGRTLPGVERLSSGLDRKSFTKMFGDRGRELAGLAGIPLIKTAGVHDVTLGTAPFGDFFFCDMLAGLYDFPPGARVHDFGCSTARVIRNLKAALPHIDAYGCDPRASSIDFITPLVPDVTFFTSNQAPPIASNDYRFDMVFAISVWSHFSEVRALEWFDEMARIIVPGGRLIFSTHGQRAVYHFAVVKKTMPAERARERLDALARGQHHYRRYPASDLDSHWGMAFLPRSWVETHLADKWRLDTFSPGLAMANQDVYSLARR